ncbi:MAG: hypothetical protein HY904_13155 [Deltaproteobacteria bacterium]|nr:hypothetical protein [Deltaproteobacteria bacterium]
MFEAKSNTRLLEVPTGRGEISAIDFGRLADKCCARSKGTSAEPATIVDDEGAPSTTLRTLATCGAVWAREAPPRRMR